MKSDSHGPMTMPQSMEPVRATVFMGLGLGPTP